ncbi:hypothetical protein [Streptomyces sp. NPDC046985]|uniref:hypothetical protein n=1 Tax=Streptomyces sp. NPDC046985 TaxID=3155377 RepID=UPI00340BC5DE
MHRTTTAAALLVALAAGALTGCVTVPRPAAPGPAAATYRPQAAHPDGSAAPRPVQAPAREALERVGPPHAPAPAAARHAAAAPPPARSRQLPPPRTAGHRPGYGAVPHRAAPHRPPGPPGKAPHGTGRPAGSPDVCALGRKYGGWRPNDPAARICGDAYGH